MNDDPRSSDEDDPTSKVGDPRHAPGVWRRPPTRSARSLSALVLLVGFGIAAAGLAQFVIAMGATGGSVPVTVPDPGMLELTGPAGLPAGVELDLASAVERVALEVDALPVSLRLLAASPFVATGALWLVGALALHRVLGDIARGRPFAPLVPRRIGVLSLVVLALTLLPGLLGTAGTVAVLHHLDLTDPLGFVILDFEIAPLVVAGILALVAGVFQHGREMTDDVAGLV